MSGSLDINLVQIFRASHLIENGLLTMRDMDAWTLTGVEHLHAERSRYQRFYAQQPQPDMRTRPGEMEVPRG